jgi:hypothetical protein
MAKNYQSITKRIAEIEAERRQEENSEVHDLHRRQGLNVNGLTRAQAVLLMISRCLVGYEDIPGNAERIEDTKRRLGKRAHLIYEKLPGSPPSDK